LVHYDTELTTSDNVVVIKADKSCKVKLPKLHGDHSNYYDTVKSHQIIIKCYGHSYNHRVEAAHGDSIDFDKHALTVNAGAITFYSLGNTWIVV
jgi:hypothetical protein